jgi:rubrerythrin
MSIGEYQLHEIEMMAKHEEAIGRLYDVYAQKLPDYEKFWLTLAEEERTHASWIRQLSESVEEGDLTFNEGRFNLQAIETSLRYLEDWTRQAGTASMTMLKALAIAADIENALIDRKFFEIYEADSEYLQAVLKALEEAAREHRDRVTAMLTKVRQGEPPGDTAIG